MLEVQPLDPDRRAVEGDAPPSSRETDHREEPAATITPHRRICVTRADPLEDARDDAGHRLDALREDREDEVRAVGKKDAGDEVMDVVGVPGLRPEARSRREPLAREARVLELEVVEGLGGRHVRERSASISSRPGRAGDLAPRDLLEEPGGQAGRHAVAVLSAVAEGLLAPVGVLAERLLIGVQVPVSARREEAVDGVAPLLPFLPVAARHLRPGSRAGDRVHDEAGRVVGGDRDHVLDGARDLRRVLQLPRCFCAS